MSIVKILVGTEYHHVDSAAFGGDSAAVTKWLNFISALATEASTETGREINVKAAPYNAVGDGETDDTAAIQAAFDALDSVAEEGNDAYYGLATVRIPYGRYRITDTLLFERASGAPGAIIADAGAVLMWDGEDDTKDALELRSCIGCSVVGLTVEAASAGRAGIMMTGGALSNTNAFIKCTVTGNTGEGSAVRRFVNGFLASTDTGGGVNNDHSLHLKCRYQYTSEANFKVEGSQSVGHQLVNCFLNVSDYGIHSAGAFHVKDCQVGSNDAADIYQETMSSIPDCISIDGLGSESSKRFFVTGVPGGVGYPPDTTALANELPLTIKNVRWTCVQPEVDGTEEVLGSAVTYGVAPDVHDDWAADTAYEAGDRVINDTGKVYRCTTAGTSDSSGGPTGTSTGIVDNTCEWQYEGVEFTADDIDGTNGTVGVNYPIWIHWVGPISIEGCRFYTVLSDAEINPEGVRRFKFRCTSVAGGAITIQNNNFETDNWQLPPIETPFATGTNLLFVGNVATVTQVTDGAPAIPGTGPVVPMPQIINGRHESMIHVGRYAFPVKTQAYAGVGELNLFDPRESSTFYMELTDNIAAGDWQIDAGTIDGQMVTIIFQQDGTGGRTVGAPWSGMRTAGAFTPDATIDFASSITFRWMSAFGQWWEDHRSVGVDI